MGANEVINAILRELHTNGSKLAEKTGLNRTQVYDILSGKIKHITEDVASKLLTAYPQFNRAWILTGEGSMLAEDAKSEDRERMSYGSYDKSSLNALVEEMAAQRETDKGHLDRAFTEMAEQRKSNQQNLDRAFQLIESSMNKMDRMLTILESKIPF